MEKLTKAKKLMSKLKELQKEGKEDTEEFYTLDEKLHELLQIIQNEL